MQEQFYTDGDVRELDGKQFECVGVSYQEDENGERHSFVYSFRLKSEVDVEREALAEKQRLEAEAIEQSKNVAPLPEPEITKPEEFKEETLNVR